MPEKLLQVRKAMFEKGIDAIIIPSSDPHQSEYVATHWQERTWLSGFTGSAGIVVITKDHAGLWTDSRYFLQAEIELSDSTFTLHKMYNQFASPHVDFLTKNLSPGSRVSVNGFMFSKTSIDTLKKSLNEYLIELDYRQDLISDIWHNRPGLSDALVEIHDITFAGRTLIEKLSDIRRELDILHADSHLITALDDLAWTFNIRGSDVAYNPVVIAYGIVSKTEACIFIDQHKLSKQLKDYFYQNQVKIYDYESIIPFLNRMPDNETISVDQNICNQSVYEAINAKIIHTQSIPKLLKSIKNESEISHIRNVMKKDGAAIAETFYWLETQLKSVTGVSECAFAIKLAENRTKQPFYKGESFGAIIGYESNGAIIHYHPDPDSCKTILSEGILLADSGGQYYDGTTDITRTISLSPPSSDQKKHYTLILKGMISLSMSKFPVGTTGAQLDTLARQFLWAEGLNYGHGTGHGVGFFLNVHEAPQGFAPVHSERGKTVLLPGMLTSNEPGYYIEGLYGMRIENLIITIKSTIPDFLEFETVTLYPFDHLLINKSMLTVAEISWINTYHSRVYEGICPYLPSEFKQWLQEKCRNI
ncbi:MAG: aminopeptidase P family protein [Saprospiraceae bacterium]|nr:aminopeptidase P family protein [Saprospiraceae bacterium]